jgi:uncharacterized phiE125 gp8 family phage protein
MAWSVTTQPATEILTVQEAKDQVRALYSAEDTLIGNYITAVRQFVEKHYAVALITQTITETHDHWPGEIPGVDWVPQPNHYQFFKLAVGPVQSITSIKYIDSDGVQQTWSTDDWQADLNSFEPRIMPAYNKDYPAIRRQLNAVEIVYQAGYGDATSDVPENLRQAIALEVADMYVNRTNYVRKMTTAADRLIKGTLDKQFGA